MSNGTIRKDKGGTHKHNFVDQDPAAPGLQKCTNCSAQRVKGGATNSPEIQESNREDLRQRAKRTLT